jgi:hypothetical protein
MSEAHWKLLFDGLTALGTVGVAILAIWSEKFKAWFAPPKLSIQLNMPVGTPSLITHKMGAKVTGGGIEAMYYHLKVINKRPWIPVHNCRVLLTGLSKRGPDGKFSKVPMPVPLEYMWAPAEPRRPRSRTVVRERVVDFGAVESGKFEFSPALYLYVASLGEHGYVRKDQAVRYYVEVDALNFVQRRPHVFEVSWDGVFDFSREKMEQHLRIREVTWKEARLFGD